MVDRQEWDGTISGEQFKTAALDFVQSWQELCPGNSEQWTWQDAPSSLSTSVVPLSDGAGGYLVLEVVVIPGARLSEEAYAIPEGHAVETTSYKDEATVLDDTDCHIYTFNVVYSESYRVPVMFFRGCLSDGSPLSWDQMRKDLPTNMQDNSEKSRWTFVTQQEHPYLHRPWFTLHPCGTAALLALVLGDTPAMTIPDQEAVHKCSRAASNREGLESQYLATWLSVIGPNLGLKIPLSWFMRA